MNRFPAKRLLRSYFVLFFLLVAGAAYTSRPAMQPETAAAAVQQTLPEIQFTTSTLSLDEDDGNVNVNVILSTTYTATVRVDYETGDGTALSVQDYVSTNNQLVWPAGSITQTIPISILDDSVYEPGADEFFYIFLLNPVNGTLPDPPRLVIEIEDNEQPSTNTPTPSSTRIFADAYEPNNTFGDAYTIAANAAKTTNITLWPTGDEDFFRFVAKENSAYRIFTSDLNLGLDTELFVYDTQGNLLGQNDDIDTGGLGDRSSSVRIVADVAGYYYARVINRDPSNPTNKTYSIEVDEVTPPTPTPSQTPVPGADVCEFNSTFETACVIEVGEGNGYTGQSFVPVLGSERDTDVYKLWMRAGSSYTCETFVNAYADTNMIFLDQNTNDFQPNLGNDNKEPGDYGSRLSLLAPYTGWLYIMVGPIVAPPYEESNLHQYDIECIATIATATPTPTATSPPAPIVTSPPFPATSTPDPALPTVTPFVFPTFPPTPTPFDLSPFLTPSPSPTPPIIQIQPLPTATAVGGGQQNVSINVTLYYDTNLNFLPELNEGIMDVAVLLYDNATGGLIAFGSTNEAGTVSFTPIASSGAVRVSVPFLSYSQVVVGGSSNILLRVAPQPLPIGIP